MDKALATWLIIITLFAIGVAVIGPTFVGLIALDTCPEGLALFLDLVR